MVEFNIRMVDYGLKAGLALRGKGIPSWEEPFKEICGDFRTDMKKQFEQGGRAREWAPLTDFTVEVHRQDGVPSDSPLMGKGKLMDSFTEQNADGHVEEVGRTRMEIGSDMKVNGYVLAALHTAGYSSPTNGPITDKQRVFFGMRYGLWVGKDHQMKTPARPVMDLSQAFTKGAFTRLARYAMKVVGKDFKGLIAPESVRL